jgi:hypothetical protein
MCIGQRALVAGLFSQRYRFVQVRPTRLRFAHQRGAGSEAGQRHDDALFVVQLAQQGEPFGAGRERDRKV